MTFVSYAQNFEDVILWRAFRGVKDGYYLDIGAQDPILDSVSLSFYQAGWRGIHVEPIPAFAAKLREARPDETVIEAAVTDAIGPIVFHEIPETGLSTGKSEIADLHSRAGYKIKTMLSPSVRLDDLLATSGLEPHWLKIDVEGMEPDVLRSWGDSPVRPWILLVESTVPGTQQPAHFLWENDVLSRGYKEVFFDGLSRYFLHESHNDIAPVFKTPANVFDRFAVTPQHFTAAVLRDDLLTSAERANLQTAEIARLSDELSAAIDQSDSCRTEIARLQDVLTLRGEQARQLEAGLARAEESLRIATAQAGEFRNEIERLNRELLMAADNARTQNAEIGDLHKQLLITTRDFLNERRTVELSLRSSFEKKLGEMRTSERKAAEAELRPQLAEALATIRGLQAEIDRIEEKSRSDAEAASTAAKLLREQLERVEKDYTGRLTEAESRSEQIKAEVEHRSREVERVEKDYLAKLTEADSRSEQLHGEVERLKAELETVEKDYGARLAQADSRSEQLHGEVERLKAELETVEKGYAARLAQADAAATTLGRSVDSARSLIVAALSAKLGWWDRVGRKLRLSHTPQAWRHLGDWSAPAVAAPPPFLPAQLPCEAQLSMTASPSITSRNPYLRANSLEELLSWEDVDFVRCAYVTILGRQPDTSGETHYTTRIRSGHSKLEVLWQLRRSAEGPGHDPGIIGLDRALKRAAFGRAPIIGWLFRLMTGSEGDSRVERRLRAIENKRAVVARAASEEIQRLKTELLQHRQELELCRSNIQRISLGVDSLQDELRNNESNLERYKEEKTTKDYNSPPRPRYVSASTEKLLSRILRTASIEG
jgi:FkbM family methyltransferase